MSEIIYRLCDEDYNLYSYTTLFLMVQALNINKHIYFAYLHLREENLPY